MNVDEHDQTANTIANEIRQYAPLTNDENIARFELLWAGDESVRDSLINGNMHWVLRVAQKMNNQSDIPISDFVAAGRVGLTGAVDKFTNPEFDFVPDETLKNRYAIWWVRLQFAKLAQERGFEYLAASNAVFESEPDR